MNRIGIVENVEADTRLLAYTCVFGGYDRIFPPVSKDAAIDYVVFTDDPDLQVEGWRPVHVDAAPFADARSANRHYKMLGHRVLPAYTASIYVDGNVRLLESPYELLRNFLQTGAALGVFPHPVRTSVAEEIEACTRAGKAVDAMGLAAEFESYRDEGFEDKTGLIEAGVLIKNHAHADLDSTMLLWWNTYSQWHSRDQISLPYVLWKTGLECHWYPRSFREPNPYFGLYPHIAGKRASPLYTFLCARAYDNLFYRMCASAWRLKWSGQRCMRDLGKAWK